MMLQSSTIKEIIVGHRIRAGERLSAGDSWSLEAAGSFVRALKGEKIQVYGDGSQTTSLCYIDDLVDGLVRFLFLPPDVTGPMNLGRPEEFTILELAQQVIDLTGSHSTIEFLPLPVDDPRQRKPDISPVRETLNWEATTSLREGLSRTIEYFRQQPATTGEQALLASEESIWRHVNGLSVDAFATE